MKTKIAAVALLALSLTGCTANIPESNSSDESKYIVACSAAGGTFVPGRETPGSSYRSACMFRYPSLPTAN